MFPNKNWSLGGRKAVNEKKIGNTGIVVRHIGLFYYADLALSAQ